MMGGLSIWHWLVVGVIILLLFGKGRFSEMMGDVAKGLKSFKKGMSEEDHPTASTRTEPPRITEAKTVDAPAERMHEADPAERREP
jgi:sec-independent protein translocase protein TatA